MPSINSVYKEKLAVLELEKIQLTSNRLIQAHDPYIQHKFTIYSKSGCINCRKVKDLLKSNNIEYEIIDCDDYLLEDKDKFLFFIQSYSNVECKTFPMVFHDEKFLQNKAEKYNLLVLTSFQLH